MALGWHTRFQELLREAEQKAYEETLKAYPKEEWEQLFREPRAYEEDAVLYGFGAPKLPWWAFWRRFKDKNLRVKISRYSYRTTVIPEGVMAMGMGFEEALKSLKAGGRVARQGWNGRGMFLFLVPGSTFVVNRAPLLGIYPQGTQIEYHPHVDMKTAQGYVVPWLCSQADMLANDWMDLSPQEKVDGQ